MIRSTSPLLVTALAAGLGLAVLNGGAFAQATSNSTADHSDAHPPQVTIEASHELQTKQIGMSYTGIPKEQVTLGRHVAYGDLNLNTRAGAAALEKRIKATAEEACHQLKSLYRLDIWDSGNQQCVSRAVGRAMQEAKTLKTTSHGQS